MATPPSGGPGAPLGPAGVPWEPDPPEARRSPPARPFSLQSIVAVVSNTAWVAALTFGAMLVPGLVIAGLAAGIAQLRRLRSDGDDSAGRFVRDVRGAAGSWPYGIAATILSVLMGLNVLLIGSGLVPGGAAAIAVVTLAGAAAWVTLLRTAAAWSDAEGEPAGIAWSQALSAAARATLAQPLGTLALLVALAGCVALVWVLLPAVLLVPGLLCLTTVATVPGAPGDGPQAS